MTGVTPKAWQQAFRARRLRETLANSETITDAVLAAGFPDSSSYYRNADAALGMTARAFRRGGSSCPVWFTLTDCTLGRCLVAESERGICAVLLAQSDDALLAQLSNLFPHARQAEDDPQFTARVQQVVAHIERPDSPFTLPLDLRGTAFQLQVWQALRQIRQGRGSVTRRWPTPSASPARSEPSPAPVGRISLRLLFPAIAWCARAGHSPATAGEPSAKRNCWRAKLINRRPDARSVCR